MSPSEKRAKTRRPELVRGQQVTKKGDFRMMSGLASVMRRHPIIAFFVLTFALSWWTIPLHSDP